MQIPCILLISNINLMAPLGSICPFFHLCYHLFARNKVALFLQFWLGCICLLLFLLADELLALLLAHGLLFWKLRLLLIFLICLSLRKLVLDAVTLLYVIHVQLVQISIFVFALRYSFFTKILCYDFLIGLLRFFSVRVLFDFLQFGFLFFRW